MKIALGADHAGLSLKNEVKRALAELRFTVTDFGTKSDTAVDYPDFAGPVSEAVAAGTHDRGILICGSGIGMAIAANKIAGVRAANVLDVKSARLSREHNDYLNSTRDCKSLSQHIIFGRSARAAYYQNY